MLNLFIKSFYQNNENWSFWSRTSVKFRPLVLVSFLLSKKNQVKKQTTTKNIIRCNLLHIVIFLFSSYSNCSDCFFNLVLDPDESCTTNQTAIELGADRCQEHEHISLICLGLYMMLSNVLLLNLLIATFR